MHSALHVNKSCCTNTCRNTQTQPSAVIVDGGQLFTIAHVVTTHEQSASAAMTALGFKLDYKQTPCS